MKTIRHMPIRKHGDFIHRHDRFKPTPANILLLGFTAGCALLTITAILVEHYSK